MKLLEAKVCLIAGAATSRSIGESAASLFAEHGAKLVLVDIADAGATARQLGGAEVLVSQCDLSRPEDCARMVSEVQARFGRLDVVVNSAGIVASTGLLKVSADDFDRMIAVNLKGAFNLCQVAIPEMIASGGGSIVNIASLAAQRGGGLVGGAHYAASKGGVLSLTRSIAREFGPQGVRANAVCPAMAQTAMLDGLSENQLETIVGEVPLRRLGTPRDVAGACLYFASSLSAYVTGATLDVNGGLHIH